MILNTNLNDTARLHALQLTDAEDIFRAIDSQRDYLGKWLPFVEFTRSVEDSVQFVTEALELPEDKRSTCLPYGLTTPLPALSDLRIRTG